ncbi:cytochrome P450 [Thalassobacter stenotrophicus]|nr:cytochrome P450 [Thalassobacter sp. 16PALIMAR09]KGK80116.1 cytochrome P450 [Thalassobacter stenotrophicus]KGL01254.1 cytochrome P450 [Thalassobacter sp. 16PALIMAR09]
MQSLSQSPRDPAFVQNPYPFYEKMRSAGPLVHWQDYDVICATDYATIDTILRDRRFGRAPIAPIQVPPHLKPFYAVEAHSMLELEPPDHTRLRGAVLRAFTNRRIKALRPEIEALCDELIDTFPNEPFDLLETYGRPLPARVIARFLGVPEGDWQRLVDWSNRMVAMYQSNRTREQENVAAAAAQSFSEYIKIQIEAKRSAPDDSLISTLLTAHTAEKLTEHEVISTCILLLNAGHEATVHTFGNTVKTLLDFRLSPQVGETFINGILRFDPPLHLFERIAYETVEIEGQTFNPGDRVALLLASGNRDATAFKNPNSFHPDRTDAKPLSFGAGIHFCIGAPLARLELEIALNRLWERKPNLKLLGTPQYADIYHFHGLESLRVTT